MKFIKAIGFVFLPLVIAALLFTGCGKKEDDNRIRLEVMYWGSHEEVEIIESIVAEWEKENPNVDVDLQHTPGVANYTNKLLTRVAGGAPPDIAFAEVGIFVDFVTHDLFTDLNPYIENDSDFSIDKYFPDVVKRFTRDGRVLGIPRDTAPFACVYYNKRMFDEAGLEYPSDDWTTDEMLEIAKTLTKQDSKGRTIKYGFYSPFYENCLYTFGGKLVDNVDNPKKCMLGTNKSIEGLQFFADLHTKYKVSPDPEALGSTGKSANQLFMTGQVAMYNSGIWESPALRNINTFDWDVAMFPKGPDGTRAFATGGSAYCILKTTEHPQEAWEVVKALAGAKGQIMMAQKGLAQPAIKEIAEGPYWAGDKQKPLNKGMLNEAVKYVVYSPFNSKWREVQDKYIYPALDHLRLGDIDAKEFSERVIPEVNEMLKEGK
jgi:ABC-type glycerol-3-phosphate transport system substrate-binding protein